MLSEKINRLWAWVRELSGDDAYERYLQHHARSHPDQLPMNRQTFFIWQQENKWNGVRRCC